VSPRAAARASERARALVASLAGPRVLVVGDVMLDEFLWGRVSRISPEAPVPVVRVENDSYHVGGAGNVAANVRSLGGRAVLAGVVGVDAAAERVRSAVAEAGIEPRLVAERGRPTTVKTRIVAHHQQVVRADREEAADVGPATAAALRAALREELPGCAAVVLSDYEKGVVTAAMLGWLLPLARRHRVPVLVDPKLRHFARYRGVTLVTPNQLEAEQATGLRLDDDRAAEQAATAILRRLRCRAVLVTRGERGMTLLETGSEPLHVPAAAREVFDVTGAGDTVIATVALAVAAGATLAEAALAANAAAGVVVGKLGTAQVSPGELVEALRAGPPLRGGPGARRDAAGRAGRPRG
jgi:D-beta-D-heptose 7-phosphate kinase/D-beta-D-heptose 1-phosphate adenosyltransferase